MCTSPFIRQIFVASSPQIAAFTVGGITAYPSILLQQFKANDTLIHLDIDSASWIASIHGIAGIPSILMPTVMQIMGRKFALITGCLLVLIGWITIYLATDLMGVILGEIFQGLGGNTIIVIGLLITSEMVGPKLRNGSMMLFNILHAIGVALISISGFFLHWKTISLIMIVLIVIATTMIFFWPESPSWLAYKGRFEECETAFVWLRGTGEDAQKELKELILAQREAKQERSFHRRMKFSKELWLKITSRDFYLPTFHIATILFTFYWSGPLILYTYAMDIIKQTTSNDEVAFYGVIIIDLVIVLGSIISCVSTRYFRNRIVMLSSITGSIVGLVSVTIVTLLQSLNILSRESVLYLCCIVLYILSCTCGWSSLCFSTCAEIMPVKHRGLGGTFYIIFICMSFTSSMKTSPYLFVYLDIWGTLLIFTISALMAFLFIWKCLPETKFRTLQEIEDFYNHGHFLNKKFETDEGVSYYTKN